MKTSVMMVLGTVLFFAPLHKDFEKSAVSGAWISSMTIGAALLLRGSFDD